MWKVSKKYYAHDFPTPSIEDKITLFEDRVVGWVLDVSQELTDNVADSSFAILLILANYFEMISKYHDGYCDEWDAGIHVRRGIEWVFPQKFSAAEKTAIYKKLRNALYHAGLTGGGVRLEKDNPEALSCSEESGDVVVHINTSLLPGVLTVHFNEYIARLRDASEYELRNNFVDRFDWQGQPRRKVTKVPPTTN